MSNTVPLPTQDDELTIVSSGRFSSVMVSHYTEPLIKVALDMANVGYGLTCKAPIVKMFSSSLQAFSHEFASRGGLQIYVDIWPFLPTIFDHSSSSAWPHTKGHPSGPLVINFKWEGEEHDSFWLSAIEKMTFALRILALEQGCTTFDAAEYYNLSLDNVTASDIYRGNMARLLELRQKYDPAKVMDRTGGFRIQ